MISKLERVRKVIKWLILTDFATSESDLAEKLGYKKSSISQILNGKVPLSDKFILALCEADKNINKVWVEDEKGSMIVMKDDYGISYIDKAEHYNERLNTVRNELENKIEEKDKQIALLQDRLTSASVLAEKLTSYRPGKDLIPFYEVGMLAGTGLSTTNDQTVTPLYYLDVPEFYGCIAFPAYSDSMEELIKNNATLFARQVERWREHLEYGQIYSVIMDDGRRYLKYVRKSGDKSKFLLVSYNKIYDDFEVDREQVLSMWLIHGYINTLVSMQMYNL